MVTKNRTSSQTDLMSPTDQVEIMFVKELGDNICTKCVGDTPVIFTPSHHIFIGIRPEQVTQESLIWDVCRSLNSANLFHGMKIRTEASMTAKNLLVNNSSDWQAVEAIGERFPQFDVVPPLTWDEGEG